MSTTDDFIGRVLDETREEIARADGKASMILAAGGIGVGAVLAGLIAGDVSLRGQPGSVWFLSIAAAVIVAAGVFSAAAAVFPRIGPPVAGRARYFTEIAAYRNASVDDVRTLMANEARNAEVRDLDQLRVLSALVLTKYVWTRRAMVLLGVGFLVAGGAAAFGTASAGS